MQGAILISSLYLNDLIGGDETYYVNAGVIATEICMYPKGYLIGVNFHRVWGNFQIARLGVPFGVPFGVTFFNPGISSLLPIPGSTNR